MTHITEEISVSGRNAQLTIYLPDLPHKKRPLVIICPGGGYDHVSEREGEPAALMFCAAGINAAVLRYSVSPAHYPQQINELAYAHSLLIKNADRYDIDKRHIFLCGFSAGAHLAASYALTGKDNIPAGNIPAGIIPAGMILCYPVITSGVYAHRGSFEALLGDKCTDSTLLEKLSLEKQVTQNTPPVFIWHTASDRTVPVENSLLFASALKNRGIDFELHIFPSGDHGMALANEITAKPGRDYIRPECAVWTELALTWINNICD
ncbi:MAG: alpha/beta hydrolase [Oscillospiraceae bacterium]|nr:alpha/beta hydrolase [Oscillospiraceae bacterium]